MAYQTVVFDLDGTLLNTLEDLTDSVNHALRESGYPTRTIEEIRTFVGNGVGLLVERSVPAETPAEDTTRCLAVFKEHYAHNMRNKTRPYDGVLPLLKALHDRGVKLAIVSNKFDAAVKELRAELFADYISVAIGESATVRSKPAPDTAFQALRELNATPETAVYVGDSDVDVQTAHNAGLPCIGVTWGFRDREVLVAAGADCIVDTPEELLRVLTQI